MGGYTTQHQKNGILAQIMRVHSYLQGICGYYDGLEGYYKHTVQSGIDFNIDPVTSKNASCSTYLFTDAIEKQLIIALTKGHSEFTLLIKPCMHLH